MKDDTLTAPCLSFLQERRSGKNLDEKVCSAHESPHLIMSSGTATVSGGTFSSGGMHSTMNFESWHL